MFQYLLITLFTLTNTLYYNKELNFISYFLEENNYNFIEEFHQYKIDYKKEYSSTYEHWYRYNIFEDNYYNILNHNNKYYTLGFNNYTDRLSDEVPKGYNGFPYFRNISRYHNYSKGLGKLKYNQIDWRSDGQVTNIKDQSQCGSCWAFSAIATIEGAHKRNTSNLVSLSEQDIVDCVPDCYGCGGGWPYLAIEYILNGTVVDQQTNKTHHDSNYTNGVDTESSYPYMGVTNQCNFTNVSSSLGSLVSNLTLIPTNNTEALIDAVLRVGPISVAINAGGDFMNYESGIYKPEYCNPTQLDHAVTVVGFGVNEKGEKYFIVKNSWGTSWGMDGYIYMSADTPNLCGIAMDACFAI